MIICVEGNVGAGKSSLINSFRLRGWHVVPEPVNEWRPLLMKLGEAPRRCVLFCVVALITRPCHQSWPILAKVKMPLARALGRDPSYQMLKCLSRRATVKVGLCVSGKSITTLRGDLQIDFRLQRPHDTACVCRKKFDISTRCVCNRARVQRVYGRKRITDVHVAARAPLLGT